MKRLIFALGLMMLAIGCVGGGNNADDGELKETSAPYKVGDLYFEDGVLGVVFDVTSDGMHGKIVSVDEDKMMWCDNSVYYDATYARDEYDGMVNTTEIMNRDNYNLYFAAWWCAECGSGWYLPAKSELEKIYQNWSTINNTLAKNGHYMMSDYYYWSSSEYDDHSVWYLYMRNGDTFNGNKFNKCYVRAVHAF